MSFNVDITGAKELAKQLNDLPLKIERNIMRAALRAGAAVIAAEAKQNVSVISGELQRSIRTSSNSKKGVVEANAVVGGKRRRGWYATFVEFGTAAHVIKMGKSGRRLSFRTADGRWISAESVQHTGARAKPFMRPAFDTKGQEAVQVVADKIKERLTDDKINVVAPENRT